MKTMVNGTTSPPRNMHLSLLPKLGICMFSIFIAVKEVPGQSSIDLQKQVSFDTHGQNTMHSLVQLASQERIPLGIIVDRDTLCKQPQSVHFAELAFADVVRSLLVDSGNTWFINNGVLEVRPTHTPEPATQILSIRFDEFNALSTTVQGLGIILSGYIRSRLYPGQGYAGDILSSSDSEKVASFTLHNVSAEDIANAIVSRASKGVWILYAAFDGKEKLPRHIALRTYSYRDDAKILQDIPCSQL